MVRRPKGPQTWAVLSRLDYGSPAFRRWMLDALPVVHAWEKFRVVAIQGGLVSEKALIGPLPKGQKKARSEAYEQLVETSAKDLAKLLPKLLGEDEKLIKYYIFTSPASNYDGKIGAQIVRRLAEIREDVLYWAETSGRLELKGLQPGEDVRVVLPHRSVAQLGGVVNYSVRPERFIREKRKQSPQLPPVLWLSDCGGTAMVRPAGEVPEPWATVPMFSRPMEQITSENQVGIRVVEYTPPKAEFVFRNYNLKDLLMLEREAIPMPESLTPVQQRIFQQLKRPDRGPRTIGQLEDALYISREAIEKAIESYAETGIEPVIVLDPTNLQYDFDQKWIQHKLKVSLPNPAKLVEDRIVAYACLHAGSAFTEYDFFLNRVPKLIVEKGATILVAAGDLVEGLYHDLDRRGEIVPGFGNYTAQEELGARLNAEVILRVFRKRFPDAIAAFEGKERVDTDIIDAIRKSLLRFYYRKGNHDDWQTRDGHQPLAHFHVILVDTLTRGILQELRSRGILVNRIRELVEEYIVYGEKIVLPSGLTMELFHPYKARMKASSGRAQEMLEASDCDVVIGGNFHVAIEMEEWDSKLGQRPALQVGTIVWKTGFEKSILKKLDVGVGYLRVASHNRRVFLTEIQFVGDNVKRPERTPVQAREALYRELGLSS